MTLSTLPIVRFRSFTVNEAARAVAAVVCAASAGVHAVLVPAHVSESVPLGLTFAVAALLLATAATVVRSPGRRRVPAVAGLLAATTGAYVLSRTTGLPVLAPEAEPFDRLGVLTTGSELLGVAACLLLALRKEHR